MSKKLWWLLGITVISVLASVGTTQSIPHPESEQIKHDDVRLGHVCVPFFFPHACYKRTPRPVGARCICQFGGDKFSGHILY